MKKLSIFIAMLLLYSSAMYAQVGIGTNSPAASAQLDVSSTSKGFLPPRMTTAQRDAITSPATGLIVYNSTTNNLQLYNGSEWVLLITPSSIAVSLPTIVVGTQQWMSKNLDVAFYRNGDTIPQVSDATAWAGLTTGAWCYYLSPTNGLTYGKLYNWYAVNDPRGLAPAGWHIPSDAEWTILENTLGGASIAGGKLKEPSFAHWNSPNTGADNSSGWLALPGGLRYENGFLDFLNYVGHWWTSTEIDATNAWGRTMDKGLSSVSRNNNDKRNGFSVRCIRD